MLYPQIREPMRQVSGSWKPRSQMVIIQRKEYYQTQPWGFGLSYLGYWVRLHFPTLTCLLVIKVIGFHLPAALPLQGSKCFVLLAVTCRCSHYKDVWKALLKTTGASPPIVINQVSYPGSQGPPSWWPCSCSKLLGCSFFLLFRSLNPEALLLRLYHSFLRHNRARCVQEAWPLLYAWHYFISGPCLSCWWVLDFLTVHHWPAGVGLNFSKSRVFHRYPYIW